MRSITIDVPDKEYESFIQLIRKFDFVSIREGRSKRKIKEEFLAGLREAVDEVNLAIEGKIKLKSAEELLHEL